MDSPDATLTEVLASVSEALFPADLGERPVTLASRSVDGDTPLHVVALRSDAHGAALLLAAGADVNAVGEMGETPLHIAVRLRDRDSVMVLVQAGARLDIPSEFGDTVRELATREGVTEWLHA